jgi:hypothetical protein
MKGKYLYELLVRHSNVVSLDSRKNFKNEIRTVKEAFRLLDSLRVSLDDLPKGHNRNVRLALLTRFTNHLFSQVILTERGLILDAINCARSATETTAFYWLVCLAPDKASEYDQDKSPRPVEVRKELEKLGVDVEDLKQRYQSESTAAHVGNPTDNWQINWLNDKDGLLLVGGGSNPKMQQLLLERVFFSALTFFKYDPLFDIQSFE